MQIVIFSKKCDIAVKFKLWSWN